MNHLLAEATTGIAFHMTLSKNQCNALLRVAREKKLRGWHPARGGVSTVEYEYVNMGVHQVGTMRTLEARGLVWWRRNLKGEAEGFQGLTRAGRLMVAILKEAGLTVENTNSTSVLNRLGREDRKAA